MIIPFVFTMDPIHENLSQTWVFYKAVSFALKNHGAVIAQEHYFNGWDRQKNIFPQFFRDDMCEMFEYDVPKKSDVQAVEKISIPEEIEQRYILKYGNPSDAYIATFTQDWPELEEFLCLKLNELIEKSNQKIEAITSLTYLKFLDNISHKLNIPILYYEWGPFRYPIYRNTAYIDIDGRYKDVESLYNLFKNDPDTKGLPVIKRTDLLALFLKKDYIKYRDLDENNFDTYDKYEIGIAAGYNSLTETSSHTHLNMLDLYYLSSRVFDADEIAVRYHPGDPLHAKMKVKNELEGGLVEFILSCKRIAAISSNVEVEAMMYGKTVYDIGKFKYKGFVNNNIIKLEDKRVNDEVLNFIVFIILVPFELLNSAEYLRFRLSNPSWRELYLYHMQYYFKCLGIPFSKANEYDFSKEISQYINIQKYKNKLEIAEAKINSIQEEVRIANELLNQSQKENENQKVQIERQIRDLEKTNRELDNIKNKYNQLINSKSMKLVKPLQNIMWRTKQIKSLFKPKD